MTIEAEIRSIARENTVGIALVDLITSRELLINPDHSFHPASTMKVAVMMAILTRFSLEDRLLVVNNFLSIADGNHFSTSSQDDSDQTLYSLVGSKIPVKELVRLMIVRSSNLATNVLLNHVSPGEVTALCAELGADGMVVKRGVEDGVAFAQGLNNKGTARSLMNLFVRLFKHQAVSPQIDQEMVKILLQQEFRQGIPAGLPKGTPIAHKTGWLDDLFHDGGFVYPHGKNPYGLVVMTQGFETLAKAQARVAKISALAYRWAE